MYEFNTAAAKVVLVPNNEDNSVMPFFLINFSTSDSFNRENKQNFSFVVSASIFQDLINNLQSWHDSFFQKNKVTTEGNETSSGSITEAIKTNNDTITENTV